ncbi:hypothetical protein LIA77_05895 [Sarocladium implicatum]|nr:hypothetical protein LIA77_05895 [Sarocladium implicatum]
MSQRDGYSVKETELTPERGHRLLRQRLRSRCSGRLAPIGTSRNISNNNENNFPVWREHVPETRLKPQRRGNRWWRQESSLTDTRSTLWLWRQLTVHVLCSRPFEGTQPPNPHGGIGGFAGFLSLTENEEGCGLAS